MALRTTLVVSFHSAPLATAQFPTFLSLTVCSRCEDLSPSVERTCFKEENVTLATWPAPGPFGRFATDSADTCQFSLPSGQLIRQTPGKKMNESEFEEYDSISVWAEQYPINQSFDAFQGGALVNVTTLSGLVRADGSMSFNASRCVMYWCVSTYNSSVTQGRFAEETIGSSPMQSDLWDVPLEDQRSQPYAAPSTFGVDYQTHYTLS